MRHCAQPCRAAICGGMPGHGLLYDSFSIIRFKDQRACSSYKQVVIDLCEMRSSRHTALTAEVLPPSGSLRGGAGAVTDANSSPCGAWFP